MFEHRSRGPVATPGAKEPPGPRHQKFAGPPQLPVVVEKHRNISECPRDVFAIESMAGELGIEPIEGLVAGGYTTGCLRRQMRGDVAELGVLGAAQGQPGLGVGAPEHKFGVHVEMGCITD